MVPRIGNLNYGESEGGPSTIVLAERKGCLDNTKLEFQIIGYIFQ